MEVADALRKIKRQFGDEYNVVIIDQDIFDWIHDAELDIIRSTADNDLTISVPSTAFPATIPDKVNIKRLAIGNTALVSISLPQLDMMRLNTAVKGGTQYWFYEGNKAHLWPMPETTTNINITYVKTPDTMDAVGPNAFTVPEVYHEDVVKYCLARAHNKNQNFRAAESEMEQYDRRVSTRRNEAQAPEAALYKIPDPLDYEDYVN
jgi:hypothetical protein